LLLRALQLFQKRNKGANHDDMLAGLNFGGVVSIDANTKFHIPGCAPLPAHLGKRIHRRNADGTTDAAGGLRLLEQLAGRPRSLPGNGIAMAELGQQTASGIDRSGVAQAPAVPVFSFTPVKNRPIAARSMQIRSSSPSRIFSMPAMVSARIVASRMAFAFHVSKWTAARTIV
jgi:hypothetical protein